MKEKSLKVQGICAVCAAIMIQMVCGIAYIWSVFQTGVADSIFKGNNAAAGLTFSLLLATLTIGSVVGGRLSVKYSIRSIIFIGGIILSSGFLLASFVTENHAWLLWLTYGVMGGVGMGFAYSTIIACVQKWYPHSKGFVTGMIVSALGLGGVIFTPPVEKLISVFGGTGVGESSTFMVLSTLFLVVCTAGSLLIKNPPEGYSPGKVSTKTAKKAAVKDHTPAEMLKTPQYYLMIVTFALACMGGLMMINFAKPIAVAKGLGEAAMIGVLAVSMFNSAGRLLWGIISDKIGRKNTIIILLSGSAVLSLFVNAVTGYWVFVLIAFIGFFYGGFLSAFPSLTADTFGAKYMATNYGFVLLGFGFGAVISSQVAGYYRNIAVDDISLMFPAFLIASCCAVAGIIMMLIFTRTQRKVSLQQNEK